MKTLKKISLLVLLLYIYVYISYINNLPKSLVLFKGDPIKIATLWGINVKKTGNFIQTSTNISSNTFENVGKETLEVSLFNNIKIKTIDVDVLENTEVTPVGEIIGIKLYTNGVLVVGTSAIEDEKGKKVKPFENTQIKEGDSIIEVNDVVINNTEQLISIINKSNGENLKIKYISDDNEEHECEIKPVKVKENHYKIGIWIRDSAAGVGTITFYNENNQSFAALGHAITDIDTGDIINTSSGEIDDVNIVSIVKGENEEPGKIQGTLKNENIIGNVYKNTHYGIYGKINNLNNLDIKHSKKMKVANRKEIQLGEAKILSDIDGEAKEYKIEIQKIHINNNNDNKSMIIKVTDDNLIKKTGGIIQGMSGSPIIQNGKFIGAITHVFVNDPTLGYAVFADKMLKEISE